MEFGIIGLQVRELIDFIKFCLASSNAAVRTNAVTVLGVLRLYIGPGNYFLMIVIVNKAFHLGGINSFFRFASIEVKSFVQDVNPTLLATIEAEFAKVADMEPPKPPKASVSLFYLSKRYTCKQSLNRRAMKDNCQSFVDKRF